MILRMIIYYFHLDFVKVYDAVFLGLRLSIKKIILCRPRKKPIAD